MSNRDEIESFLRLHRFRLILGLLSMAAVYFVALLGMAAAWRLCR